MSDLVEFASREWLALLRERMQHYATLAGPGLKLSLCEVFTGAPRHLTADHGDVVAWHCRIADGRVEFFDGETDDADLKTVTDYQFILPLARLILGPDTQETMRTIQAQGVAAGKFRQTGDPSLIPPVLHQLHNEMAEKTA